MSLRGRAFCPTLAPRASAVSNPPTHTEIASPPKSKISGSQRHTALAYGASVAGS